MRIYMGVHRFAPVAGLEGDMAWTSPLHRRWNSMLRYWNRVNNMDEDRLTKKVFNWAHNAARNGSSNWCSDIKEIMTLLNINTAFYNKLSVNLDNCKKLLNEKQSGQWLVAVQNKPKLRFYKEFKSYFTTERYLNINLSSSERSILAQIRLGILPLHVETGRFNGTEIQDRLCKICHCNEVEDEYHFLFNCNKYDNERDAWMQTAIDHCPHLYYLELSDQLKVLFCDIPRPTAKFVKRCMAKRRNILYNSSL